MCTVFQSKSLYARTHRPIFRGFAAELAVESADSKIESADSTTDSVIVGRLSILNTFNVLNPLESADSNEVCQLLESAEQIGLVGMGLLSPIVNQMLGRTSYCVLTSQISLDQPVLHRLLLFVGISLQCSIYYNRG